jgi:hypothetical protein
MKYAGGMGSDAMMYIPSFIKTALRIQKSIEWIQRHAEHGDLISIILIFRNKESELKERSA